jgi:hypothetical protein
MTSTARLLPSPRAINRTDELLVLGGAIRNGSRLAIFAGNRHIESMADKRPKTSADEATKAKALSRWEGEGGAPSSRLKPKRSSVEEAVVSVRLPAEPLDRWRTAQPDKPSRSEAIRRLVEIGLQTKQPTLRKSAAERAVGAAFAKRAAEAEVDRQHGSSGQTNKAKARQKRTLTDRW